MNKYLFIIPLAASLAACTQSAAPTPAGASVPAAGGSPQAALGYAYDAKLAVGAAWLAYLDSDKADPALVAKIDPLYRAASAALKTWSDAVVSGTGASSEPSAVTTAYAALTAAMQAAGIATTQPGVP